MITCTFENTRTAHLRHTCAATLVLNERKDALLLTKRAAHLLGGGLWVNPGGFIEMGYRAIETAVAETLQEAGVPVSIFGLVCISDTPERNDGGRQNILLVFAGTAPDETTDLKHDPEVSEVRWFPLSTLPMEHEWAFDHFRIVRHFITSGMAHTPLEKMFINPH